jgi:hypothetical protein
LHRRSGPRCHQSLSGSMVWYRSNHFEHATLAIIKQQSSGSIFLSVISCWLSLMADPERVTAVSESEPDILDEDEYVYFIPFCVSEYELKLFEMKLQ